MSPWTPLAAVGVALVTAGIQGRSVAFHAERVREVLGARDWIALPGARAELPGVVLWGGRAVPVLDLARLQSGLRPLAPGEVRARSLLVETRAGFLAVPADRVSEVYRVHEDAIRAREIRDFDLAREEVVSEDDVIPLFEPELLLERLNLGG